MLSTKRNSSDSLDFMGFAPLPRTFHRLTLIRKYIGTAKTFPKQELADWHKHLQTSAALNEHLSL